ncbi:MAG: methionine--tRNA ligase subunit beta [Planctomycetota bacterium]
MIAFAEFKKIDMKVGKILSVDKHPDADKLYIISIDIGEETKQAVAGLKDFYSIEELIGKKVIVVTNLEPAKLRGIESHVMILAAQHNNTVSLITPEKELPSGSKVL